MENIYQARDLGHTNGRTDISDSAKRCLFTNVFVTLVVYCHDIYREHLALWLFLCVVCLLSVDPIPGAGCITFISFCIKNNTVIIMCSIKSYASKELWSNAAFVVYQLSKPPG